MQLSGIHQVALLVRERRRAAGLSQAALAQKVGVSREWVVRLEGGNPRMEIGKVLDTLYALDAVPTVDLRPGDSERARDEDPDPFADVFAPLMIRPGEGLQ